MLPLITSSKPIQEQFKINAEITLCLDHIKVQQIQSEDTLSSIVAQLTQILQAMFYAMLLIQIIWVGLEDVEIFCAQENKIS